MGFFNDMLDIAKDIGTSATRIVTDTAIDLANVTTGFQFNDEMESAKKEMSDAGIYSASQAIEKNHYAFLKGMEEDARFKNIKLTELYKEGESLSSVLKQRNIDLTKYLDDLDLLARESAELKARIESFNMPLDWKFVYQSLNINLLPIDFVHQYDSRWDAVAKDIVYANLGVTSASAITSLTGLAALTKAASLTKAAKLGSAAKFTKVGKVAGKAAIVLTVASVGLDIGLSVAELESRKNKLEQYLKDVEAELDKAKSEIDSFNALIEDTNTIIDKLIKAAGIETETQWPRWIERERQQVKTLNDYLISLEGSIKRARVLIITSKDYERDELIEFIQSMEPNLSQQMIETLINQST